MEHKSDMERDIVCIEVGIMFTDCDDGHACAQYHTSVIKQKDATGSCTSICTTQTIEQALHYLTMSGRTLASTTDNICTSLLWFAPAYGNLNIRNQNRHL